jgi:hypothetical protein
VIVSGRRLGFAAAVCSGLSLGQMRAQVSHSVVVERLSLARKGGSLFKLGTFQRQFLVTQPIRSHDYFSTEFWRLIALLSTFCAPAKRFSDL